MKLEDALDFSEESKHTAFAHGTAFTSLDRCACAPPRKQPLRFELPRSLSHKSSAHNEVVVIIASDAFTAVQ